jgi:hypothetical protein
MSPEEYYNEHASQARQHESQRDRMTSIVLTVAALLTGFITYSELSVWSIPAAISLVLLGAFGFFFAGKHYERFRYHTTIMKVVRDEIDKPSTSPKSLSDLRREGEKLHYADFRWPAFRPKTDPPQSTAVSWIARQRLHLFWEAFHILIAILGMALTLTIIGKAIRAPEKRPLEVRLVK